jgi:hypothetical protein
MNGAPLYLFDKSTAIGKAAIRRFIREIAPVRDALRCFAPTDCVQFVAEAAVWQIEATPASQCFLLRRAAGLQTLGVEAVMWSAGVPIEGVDPIMNAIRDNIEYLNVFRLRASFTNWGRILAD